MNLINKMSVYIHCHIGEIPDYLMDSFESIRYVDPLSRLILITDQDIEIDGIEILEVNKIASRETEKVMGMSLFDNSSNPLWKTSMFRVFLVRDAIKHLNLSYCYHFDSDVLMFQSSDKFSHLIDDFDGLYITYHTDDHVVFGFSRFGGIEKIDKICNILCDAIFDPVKQREYNTTDMPNEMSLLCGIMRKNPDLIKTLNILPNDNNVVFDPSSYGQYFGGTPDIDGRIGKSPGHYEDLHHIGKRIGEGVLKPIMIDKKPYVEFENKKYPIMNLHIHSKHTELFNFWGK